MLGFRLNKLGAAMRSGRPVLGLYFTDSSRSLDPRITFTRASSATYIDSTGTLQTAGSGVARAHAFQHHDIATLTPLGFLLEDQSTNNALWCRDFTNAVWVKTNMTAALTATGVDGAANSASTLTATAGNATVLQSITSASTVRRTSCYVKRRTGTGTIEMTCDNGTTWTAITITSSWRRYRIPVQTLANPTVGFRIVTSGDEIDVDYFQQEDRRHMTSAILTTSATATRLADSAIVSGTNFSNIFNAAGGSLAVWFRVFNSGNAATFPGVCSINDGTQNNEFQFVILEGGTGRLAHEAHNGGVQIVNIAGHAVIAEDTLYKAAMRFRTDSHFSALNGVAQAEDTLGTMPAVSQLIIGRERTNAFGLDGCIAELLLYRAALPDSNITGLTV